MRLRAGVLGKPIGHSISPAIHNAGYVAAGLRGWCYTAHECAAGDLASFVASLGPEWAGLSLTMPLKEAALDVADEVTPLAAALGAANTLVRMDAGTWRAENTDAPGMVDALRHAGVTQVERVAVLGAGGTARAALAAALELGAAAVTVYARRPEAIEQLGSVASALGITLIGAAWAGAGGVAGAGGAGGVAGAGQADVVVSTVPKGVADPLAATMAWRAGTVLLDAIYDPWPTPLADSASAAGARVVSGLDLLLTQAVRQFELFTGVDAPISAMRAALPNRRPAAPLAGREASTSLTDDRRRMSP